MKCEDLNDALVDFVDGRLDAAAQRDVERHLEVCDQCKALVTDLRIIRAAAFMLDRREPSPATWVALKAKVAAEPAPKGRLLDLSLARRSLGGGGGRRGLGGGIPV